MQTIFKMWKEGVVKFTLKHPERKEEERDEELDSDDEKLIIEEKHIEDKGKELLLVAFAHQNY